MIAWLINGDDRLTHSIVELLHRPEVGCGAVEVVFDAPSAIAECSATPDDVIFYVSHELTHERLDRLRQLRSSTTASLAVVAPMTDNAIVVRAIRAGAEDFLDAEGHLEDEIIGFVTKIRSVKPRSKSGHLLTVVSSSAPSDGALLAANVATVIARQSSSCILLDFFRNGGDLSLLLKLNPRHNLLDLTGQEQGIDEVMFQQALARHDSGVRLLSGRRATADGRPLAFDSFREILALAQSANSSVVVASEDVSYLSQVMRLDASHRIAVVTRLDLLSLHRAQHDLGILRRSDISPEQLHLVMMSTGRPGELPISAAAKTLGVQSIHSIPDDAMTQMVSINLGHPLVLERPNSPASIAMKQLTMTLCEGSEAVGSRRQGPLASAKAAALRALTSLVSSA